MEMENIEYFFNPIIRTFKKQYLVRAYVQQPKHIKNFKSLQIYDENENRLSVTDVTKDKKIISIIEGLGIKFTSSSFHIELCLRQLMVLEDKPIFEKCLIQTGRRSFIEPNKPVTKMIIEPMPTKDDKSIDRETDEKPPRLTESERQTQLVESLMEDEEMCKEDMGTDTSSNEVEEMGKEEARAVADDKPEADKNDVVSEYNKDKAPAIEDKVENVPSVEDNNETEKYAIPLKAQLEPPLKLYTSAKDNQSDETLEKKIHLCEINLQLPEDGETVHLKRPIEVYREIYAKALEKAKAARRLAVQAFLEAKKIKNAFLSDEMEDSDDDLDNFEEISN